MCVSPILIRNNANVNNSYANAASILNSSHKYFRVPCGHCIECLQRQQNDWMQRIVSQARSSGSMCFMTLTYDEAHVPIRYSHSGSGEIFMTVSKRDVQNWIKAYRMRLERRGCNTKFKFFIASEYGPLHLRPHYHCLFFGITDDMAQEMATSWKYGFVDVRHVKPLKFGDSLEDSFAKVASYVAKYCCKGMFENPLIKDKKVEKVFRLVSKHFGEDYIIQNIFFYVPKSSSLNYNVKTKGLYVDRYVMFVAENLTFNVSGHSYPLCKYYKQKLFKDEPILQVQVSRYQMSRFGNLSDERVRQIQSERNCSIDEAYHAEMRESYCASQERSRIKYKRMSEFYSKSKF